MNKIASFSLALLFSSAFLRSCDTGASRIYSHAPAAAIGFTGGSMLTVYATKKTGQNILLTLANLSENLSETAEDYKIKTTINKCTLNRITHHSLAAAGFASGACVGLCIMKYNWKNLCNIEKGIQKHVPNLWVSTGW